jgi:poly-gamma-glutamate capsule biosynthesis protein CapA/YwtB (metallophosphatase superfamily)
MKSKRIILLLGVLLLEVGALCAISLNNPEKIQAPLVAQANQVETPVRILFVGDIFLDRYIRQQSDRYGTDFPFSCVDSLLKSADFVVGNLEGPVTDNASISEGSVAGSVENFQFTFPTTTPALLLGHNIRVVDIGNNHVNNFSQAGIVSTHRALDEGGVGYFGGVGGDEPIYRTTVNGIPFSFVSYNQFGGRPAADVALSITAEHEAGRHVIVFSHWGVEYSTSTSEIAPVALLFAQSGADAVIGAHPHIILPHTMIGDVPVYYSLGNFIFDQYWNADVTHGLALMISFSSRGIGKITEYQVQMGRDGRTCVL